MKYCLLIFSFAVILLASCSIQKRSYRKGFYFSLNHKNHPVSISRSANDKRNFKIDNENSDHTIIENSSKEESFATAGTAPAFASGNSKKGLPLFNAEDCNDLITLKKGEIANVKVIEIGLNEIKYKRCDHQDGPLIVIAKSSVRKILYSNGKTEYFSESLNNYTNDLPPVKEVHPLAQLAVFWLLSSVLISVVGIIVSLVLAYKAEKRIRAEPEKYTGLNLVRVVKIIDWIIIALAIFLATAMMIILLSV